MNEPERASSREPAETGFMRWFHLIFGHGSAHHPGGNSRQEFAGWGLFLSPVIALIVEARSAEDAGLTWLVPVVMVVGVLLIRSAKRMP